MSNKNKKTYWVYSKYAIFSILLNSKREILEILIDLKFEKYYKHIFKTKDIIVGKLKVKIVNKNYIEKKIGKFAKYQGIALLVEPMKYHDFNNYNVQSKKDNCLVIIDSMNDPNNFGALIRTCFAFDVHNIVVLERNMPTENGLILSVASGAYDYVNIYKVKNIINTINLLKNNNWWIVGLESKNLENCIDIKNFEFKNQKKAVIIGSEHKGLRRLVRESCDYLVRIKIKEKNLDSLNVVNATTVALYELS